MESDLSSIQCKAEFSYKAKMARGMGATAKQDYGEGKLAIGEESISFTPFKEPKIKGGVKGGMLRSLTSTNISIYPHPVIQYRDVREFIVEKKKFGVRMHEPYSVNPLTGQEMLAMPAMKTEMVLFLKFDDNETRDYIHRQIESAWQPHKRSESEVGYGAQSPTQQPVTITQAADGGSAGFCTQCGTPFTAEQKFCGKCGKAVP